MSEFIKNPNLPEHKVKFAAVQDVPEIKYALEGMGIECLSLSNSILPYGLSGHSDMLLCHTGNNDIFLEPSQEKAGQSLKDMGFEIFYSSPLDKFYPGDVKLNTAVGKDIFIVNKKSADSKLYEHLIKKGLRPVFTKQGYSKCSACFLTDHAVITEDESIAYALSAQSFDILLISKGDIYLNDSHYGFFGGSSGKIDKNTLAITGKLSYHRDSDKIFKFAREHSIDIIELCSGQIRDIGGILPLKEEKN